MGMDADAPQEQTAEAWPAVDISKLVQAIYSASSIEPLETSTATNADAIRAVFQPQPNNPSRFVTLFAGCAGEMDVAVDRRCLTRKEPASATPPFSAVAYTESGWTRGRLVHIFFQARPVLSA